MNVEWASAQLLKVGQIAGCGDGFVLVTRTHAPTDTQPERWGCGVYRRCPLAVGGVAVEQMVEGFDAPDHRHILAMLKEVDGADGEWLDGPLLTPDQMALYLGWFKHMEHDTCAECGKRYTRVMAWLGYCSSACREAYRAKAKQAGDARRAARKAGIDETDGL